jgi:hypothetical protein
MENEQNPGRPSAPDARRPARLRLSRTRLVMGLLLIVALAIFIELANKVVHENADAIRQSFGQ